MANPIRDQPIWLRTYQTTIPRGVKTMHGWCDLSGITAHAIISVNSPYSIISPALVESCGFGVKYTGRWRLFPGLEQRVQEQYCPGLQVNMQNGLRQVEPIVGDTGSHELILGMDWLTEHHVMIDCAHNSLVFWPPEELPVKVAIWGTSNGEGMFMGETLPKKKKGEEEDEAVMKEEEEEPFTLTEIRNDWTYHVRKDILKGAF